MSFSKKIEGFLRKILEIVIYYIAFLKILEFKAAGQWEGEPVRFPPLRRLTTDLA